MTFLGASRSLSRDFRRSPLRFSGLFEVDLLFGLLDVLFLRRGLLDRERPHRGLLLRTGERLLLLLRLLLGDELRLPPLLNVRE